MITNTAPNSIWYTHPAQVMLFDNVYPITLALKNTYWNEDKKIMFLNKMNLYCKERQIDFMMYEEIGDNGNIHFHGIIMYPHDKQRLAFKSWICKTYGKYHESSRDHYDKQKWIEYITKQNTPTFIPVNDEPLYLFDPIFEINY